MNYAASVNLYSIYNNSVSVRFKFILMASFQCVSIYSLFQDFREYNLLHAIWGGAEVWRSARMYNSNNDVKSTEGSGGTHEVCST